MAARRFFFAFLGQVFYTDPSGKPGIPHCTVNSTLPSCKIHQVVIPLRTRPVAPRAVGSQSGGNRK